MAASYGFHPEALFEYAEATNYCLHEVSARVPRGRLEFGQAHARGDGEKEPQRETLHPALLLRIGRAHNLRAQVRTPSLLVGTLTNAGGVAGPGIEPGTRGFSILCSTN